ncbi:DUF1194 domain-containing protein [Aliiroseovarius sp. PTFE2010]|uniref:DUF1194 domain-containing protein n=1 Tax=Aliiroseovarius sp. PTFE2010 TaxID=3417190 RepID=UPI003CEC1B2C
MGQHGEHRTLVRWAGIAALAAILHSAPAGAICRQALSLGLDVSGSVDRREYALQIEGIAAALRDLEVQKAFLAMPAATVRLHIYEWAGPGSKRVLFGWTDVTARQDLDRAAQTLEDLDARRPREPGTALGDAILFGAQALSQQRDCWRRTLDISADGPSNTGPRPREVRDSPLLSGATINALVVGSPQGGTTIDANLAPLVAYFRSEVIQGPQAFVEVTASYADYKSAITRKLLRELQTLAIGVLPERPPKAGAG